MYCGHGRTAIIYVMFNVDVLLLLATAECLDPRQPYPSGQEATSSNDNITAGSCRPR